MNTLKAVLAQLKRSPEEDRIFWADRQKQEYDRWWESEQIVNDIEALGADPEESAELVARARAQQHSIHVEQAERGAIRDRVADTLEEAG